jgi:type I restriction enzyme S subunit
MKLENYQLKDITGYWTGKVEASVLDETNYVSTENLIPNKGGIVHSSYVPKSGNVNSFLQNDVLISNIRPYFKKIWFANKDGGCSNDVLVFRAKENIHPLFLYYQLSKDAFFDDMVAGSNGTKMPRGNKTSILEFKLQIPPLSTQRKIASILSAYDDLIENNLKRIKLLEEKAFVTYKGIVSSAKDLKRLPLAQLATVTSSKRIFFSDYVEEGIPFYRSKEIIAKSNFESIQNPLYITEERYSDIKEKFGVPISGDLLVTSVGTIGFIHLVNDDDGDFYFKDGNLIWIRNLINKNLAYFLFFKFRTSEFREMLNSVAIGSSQKALTIETVKKIEVEVPTDESLTEFNKETKTIIKLIYTLQKQNTKLREARDILLPRLMNGQIEV